MDTQVSIASIAVLASGANITYNTVSWREWEKAIGEPNGDGAMLRLFSANTSTASGLTKDLIGRLDRAADSVFNLRPQSKALQIIQETWDVDSGPGPLWFVFKTSQQLERLSTHEVVDIAQAWRALGQVDELSGVLLELQRGDVDEPLSTIWEAFHSSVTMNMDAAVLKSSAGEPVVRLSALDPAVAAAAYRDELLALGWPTSEQAGVLGGSAASNKAQWAADKRAAGELLGVWATNGRTYRHPSFQFTFGQLHPRLKELLAMLASVPGYAPSDDPGGWRRAFWLYGSTADLASSNGLPRTPADVFASNPEAVIDLARKEAEVDPNDLW